MFIIYIAFCKKMTIFTSQSGEGRNIYYELSTRYSLLRVWLLPDEARLSFSKQNTRYECNVYVQAIVYCLVTQLQIQTYMEWIIPFFCLLGAMIYTMEAIFKPSKTELKRPKILSLLHLIFPKSNLWLHHSWT